VVGSKASHVDCLTQVSNLVISKIEYEHYADVTNGHCLRFIVHDGKFNDRRTRSLKSRLSDYKINFTDSQRQSTRQKVRTEFIITIIRTVARRHYFSVR
jgi:hypothetical protein